MWLVCHPLSMFVVYDVIDKHKATLGYSLLVNLDKQNKTAELIHKIIYNQLIATATKIKETNQCTDTTIIILEGHVQIVATHFAYLYTQCF